VYPADSTDELTTAVSLSANPINHFGIHIDTNKLAAYANSVLSGIDELEVELKDDIARCPAEKIILAGYSQGALVIHEALLALTKDYPQYATTAHIVAVLLLADPESLPFPASVLFGSKRDAGEGLWTYIPGVTHSDVPSQLTNSTAAYCNANDFVCDFEGPQSVADLGNAVAEHTTYVPNDEVNLRAFGAFGAARATR
jgi:hypothetical protein